MNREEYTAKVVKSEDWYWGWIVEVPGTICQQKTLDQLEQFHKECIQFVQELNREKIIDTKDIQISYDHISEEEADQWLASF